ncbi:MAG: ABC transporter ATP-binding protein [Brevinematia bacterium]
MENKFLLKVENLKINLKENKKNLSIVRNLSFNLFRNETLCIVGESGCGKSITALSIMRLLPVPPFEINGKIFWKDVDLLSTDIKRMYDIRGKEIAIIFQEPLTSFNPVEKIGDQILEVIKLHTDTDMKIAKEMVYEILKHVGFKHPVQQYELFPHELSGGMRQRAMIAMAIILKPELLIADEPTTSLDVTIQAQVLGLIQRLKEEYGLSMIFITHNLGIVAQIAQNVLIIYAGKEVEYANVVDLFRQPLHPYTKGLLESVPSLQKGSKLKSIPGIPPEPSSIPSGCPFHTRCEKKMKVCEVEEPPFNEIEKSHFVACWLYDKSGERNG